MNSMERLGAVLSGSEPDRVPVIAFANTISARMGGYTVPEYARSSEKVARGHRAFWERFGVDAILPFSDISQVAEAWGCKTKFIEGYDTTPVTVEYGVRNAEEWERIEVPDPWKAGRINVSLHAIEILTKELKGKVPIVGFIFSPITVATWIRGMAPCMGDILRKPDLLHRGLERIAEAQVLMGLASIEAGADALLFAATRASRDILRSDQYETFGKRYDLEILRRVIKSSSMPVCVHVCGNEPHLDMILRDYPIQMINFWDRGAIYNLEYVKKEFGERVVIAGGIDQTRTLLSGTPEEVMAEAREAIETAAPGGRFLLAPGCEISALTPEENLLAMVRAAERYGTYPLKSQP